MTVTDKEIEDFLAHYGMPGMKLGVRNVKKLQERSVKKNTGRVQKRLNRLDRVSKGKASKKDRVIAAYVQGVVTKKGADRVLSRGAKSQQKISEGKKKATSLLLKANNIRVADLNYHKG